MTGDEASKHPWKPGDLVLYEPSPGHVFGAVVASEPFYAFGKTCVRLKAIGPAYRGQARDFVPAASCSVLRTAPTLFVRKRIGAFSMSKPDEFEPGEWVLSSPGLECAQVFWFEEHGWMWRAEHAKVGTTDSYETAKLAAEEALR
jgi:hypothetical protein